MFASQPQSAPIGGAVVTAADREQMKLSGLNLLMRLFQHTKIASKLQAVVEKAEDEAYTQCGTDQGNYITYFKKKMQQTQEQISRIVSQPQHGIHGMSTHAPQQPAKQNVVPHHAPVHVPQQQACYPQPVMQLPHPIPQQQQVAQMEPSVEPGDDFNDFLGTFVNAGNAQQQVQPPGVVQPAYGQQSQQQQAPMGYGSQAPAGVPQQQPQQPAGGALGRTQAPALGPTAQQHLQMSSKMPGGIPPGGIPPGAHAAQMGPMPGGYPQSVAAAAMGAPPGAARVPSAQPFPQGPSAGGALAGGHAAAGGGGGGMGTPAGMAVDQSMSGMYGCQAGTQTSVPVQHGPGPMMGMAGPQMGQMVQQQQQHAGIGMGGAAGGGGMGMVPPQQPAHAHGHSHAGMAAAGSQMPYNVPQAAQQDMNHVQYVQAMQQQQQQQQQQLQAQQQAVAAAAAAVAAAHQAHAVQHHQQQQVAAQQQAQAQQQAAAMARLASGGPQQGQAAGLQRPGSARPVMPGATASQPVQQQQQQQLARPGSITGMTGANPTIPGGPVQQQQQVAGGMMPPFTAAAAHGPTAAAAHSVGMQAGGGGAPSGVGAAAVATGQSAVLGLTQSAAAAPLPVSIPPAAAAAMPGGMPSAPGGGAAAPGGPESMMEDYWRLVGQIKARAAQLRINLERYSKMAEQQGTEGKANRSKRILAETMKRCSFDRSTHDYNQLPVNANTVKLLSAVLSSLDAKTAPKPPGQGPHAASGPLPPAPIAQMPAAGGEGQTHGQEVGSRPGPATPPQAAPGPAVNSFPPGAMAVKPDPGHNAGATSAVAPAGPPAAVIVPVPGANGVALPTASIASNVLPRPGGTPAVDAAAGLKLRQAKPPLRPGGADAARMLGRDKVERSGDSLSPAVDQVTRLLGLLAQPLPHATMRIYNSRGAADSLNFDCDSLMPSLPLAACAQLTAAAAAVAASGPARARSVSLCRVAGLSYRNSSGGGVEGSEGLERDRLSSQASGAVEGVAAGAMQRAQSRSSIGPSSASGGLGTGGPFSRGSFASSGGGRRHSLKRQAPDDPIDLDGAAAATAAAAAPELKRRRKAVEAACQEAEEELGGSVSLRLLEGEVASLSGLEGDSWLLECAAAVTFVGEDDAGSLVASGVASGPSSGSTWKRLRVSVPWDYPDSPPVPTFSSTDPSYSHPYGRAARLHFQTALQGGHSPPQLSIRLLAKAWRDAVVRVCSAVRPVDTGAAAAGPGGFVQG